MTCFVLSFTVIKTGTYLGFILESIGLENTGKEILLGATGKSVVSL